jgi:hypothetical protein
MGVVGIAWTIVAVSRTELEWGDRVRLEHPWRSWSGEWSQIDRAWWRGGWLVVKVRGQWRRWYVRVPRVDAPELTAFQNSLTAARARDATSGASPRETS